MSKIAWRVQPKPTGAYRSFRKRGWPYGYKGNENGPLLFTFHCEDEYTPARARGQQPHAPIRVRVAMLPTEADGDDPGAFVWKQLNRTFDTYRHAKQAAEKFYKSHAQRMNGYDVKGH